LTTFFEPSDSELEELLDDELLSDELLRIA
jgi:hypothetical protein